MCEQWHFSSQIMRAIAAHHGLWEETDLPAVTLVGLLSDTPEEFGQAQLAAAIEQRLNLPASWTAELLSRAEADAATIAQMFV